MDERNSIEYLLDEDFIELISHVPKRILPALQQVLIEADATDDPIMERACQILLLTYPSMDGERAKMILEGIKGRMDEGKTDLDELIGLEQKKKKRRISLFGGWSAKSKESENE